MTRNTGMEREIGGARRRASLLALVGGLALLLHLGGAVGQDSALVGKWMGLTSIAQGDGGTPRVTAVDLDIIAPPAKKLQGNLRLGPPYSCNVRSERVGPVRGPEVFNVNETSVSGFCRHYAAGTMYLKRKSDNVLLLRLETSKADPAFARAVTLNRRDGNQ